MTSRVPLINFVIPFLILFPIPNNLFWDDRGKIFVSIIILMTVNLDYYDDSKKMEHFINSGHWEYYLNACRSFGFMVDKNIPWRLVADIASPEMLGYAAQYNMQATNRIINIGYTRTDYIYYAKFRKTTRGFYY